MIKRNNTSKKPGDRENSENCFAKINGSDLEDLSIVESDDLYESEENEAARQYEAKL
jgi:hypothetical protein